jgi:hypothetical protein
MRISATKMIKDLIDIIEKVKEKITDAGNMVWTDYNNAKELRDELEFYIRELQAGNNTCLEKLHVLFLPTGTLQEHSISNGWADEYIVLSENFDKVSATMKNHN